jgi:hypothetical protein
MTLGVPKSRYGYFILFFENGKKKFKIIKKIMFFFSEKISPSCENSQQ